LTRLLPLLEEPAEDEDAEDEDIDYIEIARHLAIIYWKQGKYDQAETSFQQILDAQEELLEDDSEDDFLDIARTLDEMASLMFDQNKTDQALPLYQRALNIRERLYGPSHPQVQQMSRIYEAFLDATGKLPVDTPLTSNDEPSV
jgi:tetratricopeptide (TPR) repeat protein